ncbi:hypothetical protein C499_14650 [Halogeometricum borinquense DSM 11551]|uniref:UPF0146 protein Hbor_27650 n=2 Tax=Halogeometricum borinquense TaxID=60847 RepID=E4NL60_HALBP|nr:UPF0146 family protein [Halogeometricum borinquense]ADQ68309.1 uncharacterized conserved protein [Halogeometricum borinquense DSM 11551]ELY24649.1 hypothetical protein C499_14650 [Halogeometricum borinquense DSM 11551]RYJ12805.1 hypothetical protein ELS19_01665 [Halogeometricum borinquense]
METVVRDALVARLSQYETVTEIGVGRRPSVAVALADAGCDVTVTDVHSFDLPSELHFVADDVVVASDRDDPGPAYHADAIYALNLPPELHRPARDVAAAVDAEFLFTTLGFDSPTVPCETETIADGAETLYVVPAGRKE